MQKKPATDQQRSLEMEDLRARLDEAEETLRAIRGGEVDALVVSGAGGEQVFTLQGADHVFRLLIEAMNEGTLTMTANGVILYANRYFAEMLRTPLERIIGSTITTWIAPDSQMIFQSLLRKGAAEGRRELMLASGDGEWVPAHCSVSTLLIDEMPDLFCAVVTDLRAQKREHEALIASETLARELLEESKQSHRALQIIIDEQKRAEAELYEHRHHLQELVVSRTAELEHAKSVAEQASLAKSDFLSSMSHELRTPLNAILGFAQLLDSGPTPPTPSQKRSIDRIAEAGWYLLELINEILDLALIESGKISLSWEAVPLADVMLECQALVEPLANKRGIGMSFPRFDIPCFIRADRTRLKQILINLLYNAIKYNKPEGTVAVECTPAPRDAIRISVRDTGAGLAPQQLAQLFQPFNRLGRETGTEEGTGIGLVVAKHLVELMGGTIHAESAVGVGSEFSIELRLAAAPLPVDRKLEHAAVAVPRRTEGTSRRTVLYVEDNPANLELVEELMKRRPELRLLSAADGSLGMEFARTYLPEVILMDIHLPGVSGIEAMKTLRADPATAHIPIIAVSAYALPRDIEQALEAGFFNYLTKPIKVNEFMAALDVALQFSQTKSTLAAD